MGEDWFLYSLTFVTFIVIFVLCYIRHIYTFFERNKIPCASYPSFPFGNVYDVVFQKTPMFLQVWKFYKRFQKRKCKLGGFYVLLKPGVIILDAEATKVILAPNTDHFRDLSDKKQLSNFNNEFCHKILLNILKSCQNYSFTNNNFATRDVNVSELVKRRLIEISLRDFFSLDISEKNRHRFNKSIFEQKFCVNIQNIISISYPQIKDFFKRSMGLKNKYFYKKNLEDIINNRKKNDLRENDIIQILLEDTFSVDDMMLFILDLIDNFKISNNLTILALYELSLNSDIQDNVRREVMEFKESHLINTLEEIDNLHFLERIVRETLRKYPATPFVHKVCVKEYSDNGWTIPEGTLVFVSIFGIHHDACNYVNPQLFEPNRFLEETKLLTDDTPYMPFGRETQEELDQLCIRLMMKLTLLQFLTKFKFSLKKSVEGLIFHEDFSELRLKEDVWLQLNRI